MDAGARVTQEQLPRSYTTKVINGREVVSEGPNIDDKEETDSLRAMQPSGDSPYLATESLTSFDP